MPTVQCLRRFAIPWCSQLKPAVPTTCTQMIGTEWVVAS
jgi:hypothetical protein